METLAGGPHGRTPLARHLLRLLGQQSGNILTTSDEQTFGWSQPWVGKLTFAEPSLGW
jgi:hypothetical protein